MYGWRGRIGLIIPSSNTTMEPEFYGNLPEGVSLHTARLLQREATPEDLKAMASHSLRAAEELATAGVDVIIYGCTTGSLLEGISWERKLVDDINSKTGIVTLTTARCVVEALNALGARRVAIATPYIDELNRREKDFIEQSGIEVKRIKGLGIRPNLEIGAQQPVTAYRLARELYGSGEGADCVFISCTNFRTFEVIDVLEEELGVPVISSNLASFWGVMRSLRIRNVPRPIGTLLREKL